MRTRRHLNQTGFTIIELMIATVVLSVALLIATMTIMGVGRLYFKGQNAARTNDTARNAIEEVSRQIQFSAQPPNLFHMVPAGDDNPDDGGNCPLPAGQTAPPGGSHDPSPAMWCIYVGGTRVYAYCIDSTRYSFAVGRQFIDGTTHGLWEDTMSGADTSNCKPLNVLTLNADHTPSVPSGAVSSLGGTGKELLLPHMQVTGFEITQNTSTGAYQIKLDVAYGDSDLLKPPTVDAGHPSLLPQQCKTTVGDQFCAVTNLTTSVTRRLE